jgi:ubiquinone/menaquinone biosynthesis C-methylase UbiE
MKEDHHTIEKQSIEMNPIETDGFVLDIGGGGEGIIGKLNGRKVTAIDKRTDELEKTNNDSLKIVMDVTDMKFLPSSFEVVTSFFSLMYIKNIDHSKVFQEVHKVMKNGGKFFIWDVSIPPKNIDKSIFVIPLEIILPNDIIETGYGTKWDNKEQNLQYFKELAGRTKFKIVDEWFRDEIFHLELMKRT